MASDQLMLVDAQPQTIVVDQQQIAYQSSSPQQQFIVQEANVEQRQLYYMQDSNMQENNHSEATACETPIVLNHHLQTGHLRGPMLAQKVAAQHLGQQGRSSPGIVQVRQQLQVRLCAFLFVEKCCLCCVVLFMVFLFFLLAMFTCHHDNQT